MTTLHQYIDRQTSEVKTENLYCDRLINYIYSSVRENYPALFKALTSTRVSDALGFLQYDWPLQSFYYSPEKLAKTLSVDLTECLHSPRELNTPRKFFDQP